MKGGLYCFKDLHGLANSNDTRSEKEIKIKAKLKKIERPKLDIKNVIIRK